MKTTRFLLSAASALTVLAGSATPALAYRRDAPPIPTTTLRQSSEIRELYADSFASILSLSKMYRGESALDTTGRSMLSRGQIRTAQRNYRRHVLGYLRGVDYRILNVSGYMRGNMNATGDLPFSLVQTGGGDNFGDWQWDRPTRRDIRENNMYRIDNRDRNILEERNSSSR